MKLGIDAGAHTLDLAVAHGVHGVPISVDRLVEVGVQATLAPLAERGLSVCQIGAFGYNALSEDREGQARQTDLLKRAIPLAAETGCPYIVICGGNYHPSGFGAGDVRNLSEEALDEIASALSPLLMLAEQHGVKVSIEPYLKTAIYSAERFLALYTRVKSEALRVNIDPTSLYDYWDLMDPSAKVREVCTSLVGHYGLVHIKEVALAEGFHLHAGLASLGEGKTDWVEMLRLIAPYVPEDSWVILEHILTPEEGAASLRLLRATATEAGVSLS